MEEYMNERFGGAEELRHQNHQHQNEEYCSNVPASSGSGGRKVQSSSSGEEEDYELGAEMTDLRRGPWTVEEDHTLMSCVATHGEGRWNSLVRCAGLKRTGKSCRLRWLNYLRPNVRRGNITLEEQLLILELHSHWGNRWSKIAQHFPGRTDNEIKNYWRTRVQKHAKQLKCDVNSKQFKDTMRYLWMPRLVDQIKAAAAAAAANRPAPLQNPHTSFYFTTDPILQPSNTATALPSYQYSENSNTTGASSDSFNAQVSPFSDMAENHHQIPGSYNLNAEYLTGFSDSLVSPGGYYHPQGVDFQSAEHNNNSNNNNYDNLNQWVADEGNLVDNLWNIEDIWVLQQQHFSNNC